MTHTEDKEPHRHGPADIQDDTMQFDDDLMQDSIQRVLRLATEAPAAQQTTWSLYGALDAAQRQKTRTTDENPDPRAYAQ